MPLTDVNNVLQANISSVNQTTQNPTVTLNNGNVSYNSNVGQYTSSFATTISGDNLIPLPTPICTQVYVRNIDPKNFLIVKWQPTNNAGVVIAAGLGSGETIILWSNPIQPVTPQVTTGITELIINTVQVGTLVEYFLGG